MDGVKELAHDGNDSLHRGFLAVDEFLVERLDVGFIAYGDQRRPEECSPEVWVTQSGNAGRCVKRFAGLEESGIEPRVGDPLPRRHVLLQNAELSEDPYGAGLTDSSDRGQMSELLAQLRGFPNEIESLGLKVTNPTSKVTDVDIDVVTHDLTTDVLVGVKSVLFLGPGLGQAHQPSGHRTQLKLF